MDLERLEKLFFGLEKILNSEGVNGEAIEQILVEIYDNFVSKYRPVVNAVPVVVDKLVEDLMPLVAAFLRIANKDFPEVEEEVKKRRQGRAMNRYKSLKIYMEAGFSRPEAMRLLLQDAANVKAMVSDFRASSISRAKE